MTDWISVKDSLPELGTPVLATDNIEIDIAMFRGSGKWSTENWNDWEGVVAWTPLPAMPKPTEVEE